MAKDERTECSWCHSENIEDADTDYDQMDDYVERYYCNDCGNKEDK